MKILCFLETYHVDDIQTTTRQKFQIYEQLFILFFIISKYF